MDTPASIFKIDFTGSEYDGVPSVEVSIRSVTIVVGTVTVAAGAVIVAARTVTVAAGTVAVAAEDSEEATFLKVKTSTGFEDAFDGITGSSTAVTWDD